MCVVIFDLLPPILESGTVSGEWVISGIDACGN